MKKVFLIQMFDAETKKYLATYNRVFATKELAMKQKELFNNENIIFTIVKVDMYLENDYVQ